MKWCPPKVEYEDGGTIRFFGSVDSVNIPTSLTSLPSSFQNPPEMLKQWSPHILEEGRMSVHQEYVANSDNKGYWTRDSFELQLQVSSTIPLSFYVESLTTN